ncbi:MAG: asparagine synthetase B [Candidatus Syntrophoarchaeum sp. GoM_oil]|nr:MAG: asparagine synthetase B [Candidatus Syntrophoarchaeum sp. GoM_oil]
MCGITGIYNLNGKIVDTRQLQAMTDSLKHRGPDDEGYILLNSNGENYKELIGSDSARGLHFENITDLNNIRHCFDLAFGHRRLSIIDLSSLAHQPISNEEGSLWLVYNGEIYNYVGLRRELEELGHAFKSKSDTEVVLHAYEEWGVNCLQKFNGMWAFAIYDLNKKELFCSRDRLGIKPFYYFHNGERFVFASEIKSLLEYGVERKPNNRIIYDFLAFGLQDHTGETFFEEIKQLEPASYLVIKDGEVKIEKYWDVEVNGEIGHMGKGAISSKFYELFEESIKLRLRSDVPVGTCLSGGLDSSSIVCLVNRFIDKKKQKTFSSCFDNKKFDERKYIEKVIEKTGADKNYIFPEGEELLEEIADLIYYQDEPFGSLSIYAQWNVMKRASEKVKVLLDGQGGDELLAGYLEYYASFFKTLVIKKRYCKLMKEMILFLIFHPTSAFELLSKWKLRRGRRNLLSPAFESEYGGRSFKITDNLSEKLLNDLTKDKLPALLHYEDRNSMAFSIEARVPFLDYRLVEYVASLSLNQKLNNGMTKIVFREAMHGVIPEKIRRRRDKMGFVTPEEVWMKTVLKSWVIDILSSKSFKNRKYWDAEKVLKEFGNVFSGKKKYTSDLWRYVCLELWMRRFVDEGMHINDCSRSV